MVSSLRVYAPRHGFCTAVTEHIRTDASCARVSYPPPPPSFGVRVSVVKARIMILGVSTYSFWAAFISEAAEVIYIPVPHRWAVFNDWCSGLIAFEADKRVRFIDSANGKHYWATCAPLCSYAHTCSDIKLLSRLLLAINTLKLFLKRRTVIVCMRKRECVCVAGGGGGEAGSAIEAKSKLFASLGLVVVS